MSKPKIKKTVKRRATVLGIFFFLAFIFLVVTSLSYVYQIRSLKKQEAELNSQLEELQLKEKELSSEISKLKDPDYIAKYAREKYYYTKDGEYVIKIDDDDEIKITTQSEDVKIYYVVGIGLIFIGFVVLVIFLKSKSKKIKSTNK